MKKIDVRRGEVRGPGWGGGDGVQVASKQTPAPPGDRARGQGDQDNAQHSAIIPQQ